MKSNGVEVRQVAPPPCENCSTNPAWIAIADDEESESRDVCKRCVQANDGRPGWPIYGEVVAGMAIFALS